MSSWQLFWTHLFEGVQPWQIAAGVLGAFFAGGPAILATAARLGSVKLQKYMNRLLHDAEKENSLRPQALPRGAEMTSSKDPHDAPTRRFIVQGTELDEMAPCIEREATREARRAQEREWELRDRLARKDELLEREHALRLMAEERNAVLEAQNDYLRKTPAGVLKGELDDLRKALNSGNTTHLNLPGAGHAHHIDVTEDYASSAAPTPTRPFRALRSTEK